MDLNESAKRSDTKKTYDFSEKEIVRVAKLFNRTETPTLEQIEEVRHAVYVVAMMKKMQEVSNAPTVILRMRAAQIYDYLSPEFRINIEEYVNDKPLSDIRYRNESITHIMSIIAPEDDPSFWHALEIMGDFIQAGKRAADDFCYNYKFKWWNQ